MYVSPWSGEGLFDASPARIFSYKILDSFRLILTIQTFFIPLHPFILSFFLLRYLLFPDPDPSLHLPTSSSPYGHASQ